MTAHTALLVSATRDAGFALNWLYEPGLTDIVGSARVFNLPDVGAFEYIPTGDEFGVSVSASAYTGTDTLTAPPSSVFCHTFHLTFRVWG